MPPHTLWLFVVVCALLVSVTSEPHTFQHRDPMSRKMLICDRCPVGFYMKAPCTPNRQTICASCPLNHFTQFHNYLPKCLYCFTFYSEHQVVKECTAFNGRVCECQESYYKRADFCVKHRDCPPGEGVKQREVVPVATEEGQSITLHANRSNRNETFAQWLHNCTVIAHWYPGEKPDHLYPNMFSLNQRRF
ncbi:tumor necrosis factor receptor superfamily member 11B-like [Alosa sapidissima]|uniref:tumor necrosis factor receptor superfamily member 11B-like n=1 Tax=Alosa sapidissima TaxID=34773 RepID=UPI001C0927A8|nr:tumor necrosis factor receptor superfamily member 11B-like [Alosa sapidissima]